MEAWINLILGFVLLIVGGEFLVRGGVSLAKRFRVSSLVIGLTIVAFGTSAPELLVSLEAALSGHPEISIGNVVGSNIANVGLILGAAAMMCPLAVNRSSLREDMPVMIMASVLFLLSALDGKITWIEGLVGIVMLVLFILRQIHTARKGIGGFETVEEEEEKKQKPVLVSIIIVLLSCFALAVGAERLIEGATVIAEKWGVSQRVIGVSIVAVGTSLPELVTSVIAAIRKQSDIAIGNIVGSNIFNIFCIIGISSTIKTIQFSWSEFADDFFIMIAFAVVMYILTIIKKPYNLSKVGGSVLLLMYIAYMVLLFNRTV